MASGYGMKGHVAVNFQQSFGTAYTSSLQAISVINESLVYGIEPLIEQGMYGRFDESPYHEGAHSVAGDITFEPHPDTIGYFLQGAFGAIATDSGGGRIQHTITPATSDFDDRAALEPMTIEVNRDVGSSGLYEGCLINNLSLNIANGEILSCTAGMIGRSFSRLAATTPTFETNVPWLWDQFSGSYNGAAITDLTDLNVSLSNNLEASHVFDTSKNCYRIKRSGMRTLEVTGTMVFAQHSYMQAWEAQAENAFVMNFHTANSYGLVLDFSKLRFKTFEPQMAGAGLIEASFAAQAIYDTSSARTVTVTLTNDRAGY